MNEALVQWTLLNNLDYLGNLLQFPIAKKIGQEVTTDYGRIDFIIEDLTKTQLILELETIISNEGKFRYCTNQILNYKNVKFSDKTDYCILFASETNNFYKSKLQSFGIENNVLTKLYSINSIKNLYADTLQKLSLNFGLALPKPKTYEICYLRWLNKIMKPFKDFSKQILEPNEIALYFSSFKSTNFKCYLRLALDFEMLQLVDERFLITQNGLVFISNFNPQIDFISRNRIPSVDLTNEQKRILLKLLTNGNWTVHKVNIYWFFRFIEVTDGAWIPNYKEFEQEKLDLVNGLFGVSYKKRTMFELLNFTCNFCQELGLVERIKSTKYYDKLYLTPLGVEVNNIFSLDLNMKRNRLNLSFKYLE